MKNEIEIPAKIHEIISYLSFSFSSHLPDMNKEDLKQNLYVLYLEMLQKDERAKDAEYGYFFWRFKRHLITLYNKEVKRVCREWELKLMGSDRKTEIQSNVGYLKNKQIKRTFPKHQKKVEDEENYEG